MSRATRFIDACYRRPTDLTPVWLMRQAGRYQASYRALRAGRSFLELCQTPELAARVTVNAVDELDVDAAIIFSDILVAVQAMGASVDITDQGPVLASPVRDEAAVAALRVPDPTEALPQLLEAVRLVRRALDGRVPLIGFAGAPLTLASYLVEGGNSKSYTHLKGLLFGNPRVAHALLDKLARTVAVVLRAQVEAGCQAVQLFDSWGGILGPRDFRELSLPYLQRIMAELAPLRAPRILFATGASTLLELMRDTGAEVIGVDWRVDLDEARRRLGPDTAVQGNLDPGCLFLEPEALEARAQEVLDRAGAAPGHIFNLGHGVLPGTPEEHVRALVQTVHRLSARTGP
jgi:uroporphyrinogen decarboxylase